MSGSGLISSDSHVVEPPDLWTTRIARRFRERAPRVQRESDGDWWYIDGKRSMSFLGVQTGDRFHKDATELIISARFEQVRPAAHDPHAFVAENLQDGVAGSVLYPSEGLLAYGIPDSELCSAVMAAYNDFIAEFCAAEPRRDPVHVLGPGVIVVGPEDDVMAEQRAQDGIAGHDRGATDGTDRLESQGAGGVCRFLALALHDGRPVWRRAQNTIGVVEWEVFGLEALEARPAVAHPVEALLLRPAAIRR